MGRGPVQPRARLHPSRLKRNDRRHALGNGGIDDRIGHRQILQAHTRAIKQRDRLGRGAPRMGGIDHRTDGRDRLRIDQPLGHRMLRLADADRLRHLVTKDARLRQKRRLSL